MGAASSSAARHPMRRMSEADRERCLSNRSAQARRRPRGERRERGDGLNTLNSVFGAQFDGRTRIRWEIEIEIFANFTEWISKLQRSCPP
jgi:hypothetical protein